MIYKIKKNYTNRNLMKLLMIYKINNHMKLNKL